MEGTLYVTDLDGTLLDGSARLSEASAEGLNRLYEAGVPVTFITARTPATVQPIMAEAPPVVPGVAMTGAALWDARDERYQRVAYHLPGDVAAVMEICRRHGVTPFVYTLAEGSHTLQVYHEAPALTEIERDFVDDRTLNDLKHFNLGTEAPAATADHTVLFFAMGDPASIHAVAADVQRLTDCYASSYPDTYNPGLALLEVFTAGVSKGAGLLELKELVGAERVVAFGDNLNDISMLCQADVAVAVGNAHPDVKAMADIVIGPNTDDSVVSYILSDTGLPL